MTAGIVVTPGGFAVRSSRGTASSCAWLPTRSSAACGGTSARRVSATRWSPQLLSFAHQVETRRDSFHGNNFGLGHHCR